jgi:hypothetical protein
MPREINKEAGITVKNYKGLVEALKNTGKNFADGTPADVAKQMMFGRGGTGSFVMDIGGKVLGKKMHGALTKNYSKIQRRLADIDIKGGNKLREVIKNNKGGFRDKVGDAFSYKYRAPLKESAKGVADESVHVNVPSLSAPLEKTKKFVLPLVGGLTIASKMSDIYDHDSEHKDGDSMEKQQMDKEALIEKIAKHFGVTNESRQEASFDTEKVSSVLSTASQLLKLAAKEHRRLSEEVEKLAFENVKLHGEAIHREKLERSEKLAHVMIEKGIIKKADRKEQIQKLSELDDAGFDMLKTAIENVNIVQDNLGTIDNLTFLDEHININNIKDKKTLAESLENV